MFLLVFLCFKLSLLHVGACYVTNTYQIILMDDPVSSILNQKLIEKCKYSYEFIRHPGTGIEDTLKAILIYNNRNVINLNVKDYYHFNNDILFEKGLIYAGEQDYFGDTITTPVCVVNQTKKNIECIEKRTVTNKNVKLVSDSVAELDGGNLFNFISNDYYRDNEDRYQCTKNLRNSELAIILVCIGKDDMTNFKDKNDRIDTLRIKVTKDECRNRIEDYKHSLLAVVASEQFDIDHQLSIPIIFYNTQYLTPEHEMFSNPLVLTKWASLKRVFLKFMEKMNWRRVAIISDDSMYSYDFEEELTHLFRENLIMYCVKRIKDKDNGKGNWNYEQVIQSIKKDGVKIIIANFDEKHGSGLSLATANLDHYTTWLLRDWSLHTGMLPTLGTTYSLTLGPTVQNGMFYSNHGLDTNNIIHTRIAESIKYIRLIYRKIKQDTVKYNELQRNKFYREFKTKLAGVLNDEQTGYVLDRQQTIIAVITVNNRDTIIKSFKKPKLTPVDVVHCAVRGNNYSSPCVVTEILLLMFVIMIFFTTVLLIVVYFHKSSPLRRMGYRPF